MTCPHHQARPYAGKLGDMILLACPCGYTSTVHDVLIHSGALSKSALESSDPALANLVRRCAVEQRIAAGARRTGHGFSV